jgi:phage terminase large subunit
VSSITPVSIYAPRKEQFELHSLMDQYRFGVIIAHRRLGKSVCAVNQLIGEALYCQRWQPRCAYIAPTFKRAKQIAWDFLKYYAKPFGGKPHETELRIDFPPLKDFPNGGGRVRLFGCDYPDSIKGVYMDAVVLDEFDEMPERVFTEVVRPLLMDRPGKAFLTGTPRGKQNLYNYLNMAKKDADWFWRVFDGEKTGILPESELQSLRNLIEAGRMTQAEYDQEICVQFTGVMQGAYWQKELTTARKEGRITAITIEPGLPVCTAWDLGIGAGNETAIWFFQVAADGVRFVDFYENEGQGLGHYVGVLADKKYRYGTHYAPHDISVRELGTGKSRFETAAGMGLNFKVVPRVAAKSDSIEAARQLLRVSWFDDTRCRKGIEHIEAYRRQWSEDRGVWSASPYHDRNSNASDAAQCCAMGIDQSVFKKDVARLAPAEPDAKDYGWGGKPGAW